MEEDSSSLRYAGEEIRNDREAMLKLMEINMYAQKWLGPQLVDQADDIFTEYCNRTGYIPWSREKWEASAQKRERDYQYALYEATKEIRQEELIRQEAIRQEQLIPESTFFRSTRTVIDPSHKKKKTEHAPHTPTELPERGEKCIASPVEATCQHALFEECKHAKATEGAEHAQVLHDETSLSLLDVLHDVRDTLHQHSDDADRLGFQLRGCSTAQLGSIKSELHQVMGTVHKQLGKLDTIETEGLSAAKLIRAERKELTTICELLEERLEKLSASLNALKETTV